MHCGTFHELLDAFSDDLGTDLFGANDGCHNARTIDGKLILFTNLCSQRGQKLTCSFSRLAIFTLAVDIAAFGPLQHHTEDDNALSIADAAYFVLSGLQILRRIYHLPDMMVAIAPEIIVSLQARVTFHPNCTSRP